MLAGSLDRDVARSPSYLRLGCAQAAAPGATARCRASVDAGRSAGRPACEAGGHRRGASRRSSSGIREQLRYVLPAYVVLRCWCCVLTQLVYRPRPDERVYYNSLLVLSSFLLILALGQGAVILTGGLDLSVPWTIGLCGILLAGIVNGSERGR